MAGEWQSRAIGKAFAVNPPRTIKRGQVTPFIPMDALPEHARSPLRIDEREFTGSGVKFQNGDTLIARITPCLENGKIAFVSGLPEGVVAHGSTEYIVLAGKPDESDNLFAYYLARSPDFRQFAIGHMEGTSGRQRVPSVAVENFTVTLPPLPEQRAIAHILGTLDDKIELNRRMNETLEAIARAIFKSWFVDFDPVRAKASGEAPESICRRLRLTPDLLALFPDHLVDSELGEIPEGWEVSTLGEHIEILDSKRIPLSNREREVRRGEYPYYGAASVMDYVDDYIFDGIYVLMGEDGSVVNEDGSPVIQYVWGKFWVNNHAHVLLAKAPMASEHLLLLLKQTNIAPFVTGAVQAKLSQGNLRRIPFVSASDQVVEEFSKLIGPVFDLMRSRDEETRTLANTRDALLPKLLSGELRVQDDKTSDAMKGVAYG